MTRHIADQPRERRDDLRLKRFLQIERRRKPAPTWTGLRRRKHMRTGAYLAGTFGASRRVDS